MQPLLPIPTAHLFPELRQHLLALLADLSPGDWQKPTTAGQWTVKDVALHILGGDLGNLARRRDHHSIPSGSLENYSDLVVFINRINHQWVDAARRFSPRIIIDLLDHSGRQADAYFASLDPNALGTPVNWAGPDPAPQLARRRPRIHRALASSATNSRRRQPPRPLRPAPLRPNPRHFRPRAPANLPPSRSPRRHRRPSSYPRRSRRHLDTSPLAKLASRLATLRRLRRQIQRRHKRRTRRHSHHSARRRLENFHPRPPRPSSRRPSKNLRQLRPGRQNPRNRKRHRLTRPLPKPNRCHPERM